MPPLRCLTATVSRQLTYHSIELERPIASKKAFPTDPKVLAAYKKMKEKGIYEKSLLYTGQHVRHYGLSNHKEYFAESTESYFGMNDFYPFVRAELKEHDPAMHALMVKIWGRLR